MKHIIILSFLLWSSSSLAQQSDIQKQNIADDLVLKGYQAYEAKQYETAAKFYIESLQYWPRLDAVTNLCNLYLYGQGVPQNLETARKLCEQSAAFDHPNALTMLGEIHLNGKGVPEDKEKALGYYRKAANLGHVHAQYVMWLILRETAPEEAKLYLEKSAKAGHSQAKRELSK